MKVPMVTVTPQAQRNILREPSKRKGFVRRWIMDDPAQVDRMTEEEGYQLVQNEKGDGPVKRREYVLVEIPESLYNAKQAEKVAGVYAERTKMHMSARARREMEAKTGATEFRGKSTVIGGVELTGGATGKRADLSDE